MNLRQVNLGRSTTSEVGSSHQLASLRMPTFANDTTPGFMGNMGEPLDFDQHDREDDDVHANDEQPVLYPGEEPDI